VKCVKLLIKTKEDNKQGSGKIEKSEF